MSNDTPYYGDQMFPEAEDWVPEDETPEPDIMERIGEVYRLVTPQGNVVASKTNQSGLYDTEVYMRNALRGFRGRYTWGKNLKMQRADIVWTNMED